MVGARVRIQSTTGEPVITDASGHFIISANFSETVKVTAGWNYQRGEPNQYLSGGAIASPTQSDIQIHLKRVPDSSNPTYEPIKAAPPNGCADCHAEYFNEWGTSGHALAAEDYWVRDLFSGDGSPGGANGYVFKDVHPGETGFCASCHTPVAEAHSPGEVMLDEVESISALEGVNCSACHQIDSVNHATQEIHLVGNATMRFPRSGNPLLEPTHFYVWGPLDDVDYPFMRASYTPIYSDSRYCATCHEYENPETGAPGQQTYSEWLASPFAIPGPGFKSCQECHMPKRKENGSICDPPDAFETETVNRPASQRSNHSFVGSTLETLRSNLALEAFASIQGSTLEVFANLSNFGAGHAFPTGVSIRNAILVVSASVDGVPLIQTGGPTIPFWADDDVDGKQQGDLAGKPGKGYAKVLEGRLPGDEEYSKPVLFIDAERVFSNTLIPSGVSDRTKYSFAFGGGVSAESIEISIRLLYRRAYRALAVTKGWTETPMGDPVEWEVFNYRLDLDTRRHSLWRLH